MEIQSFRSVFANNYDALQGQLGVLVEQTLSLFKNPRHVCQNNICQDIMVPVMNALVYLCLAMSVMLFVDRVSMAIVKLVTVLLRRTPEKRYKWEAIKEDSELGRLGYPMVLVQIPMYNEREVYALSIRAACGLSWPSNRLIIQVLDDSTDEECKDLVEFECIKWANKGVNIKYEIRDNRNGYKAGALKEGMKHSYVMECDYVAIFDADFQPEPDFLCRTIPFLVHNPELGLVQARWKFERGVTPGPMTSALQVNSNECIMTRILEMSLNYHFTVEQEVGSQMFSFFGFNGTAGVWRISAINEAGGWKDRTTVEDMDLAVRASLQGSKFIFLGDLKVKSELPSTLKAYRYQQHRWSCGPANLFKKMAIDIAENKNVSVWMKFYVIYSFFFVRKIVAHIVTFVFYCIVLPASVLVPGVEVPTWAVVFIPTVITTLHAFTSLRSLHLLVFWIVFETVMSMHRTKATFIGLLEIGTVNEWVVTEKLGDALKVESSVKVSKNPVTGFGKRIHGLEVSVGLYLFLCACYDAFYGNDFYYVYFFIQSIAFFVVGFGYVGTYVPDP